MTAKMFVMIVIFVTNIRFCQSRLYEHFSLYSVIPTELYHLKFLQNLEKTKYMDVTFWKKPNKLYEDVHFIVNPIDREMFMERAAHFKINVKMLLSNVQEAFFNQTAHPHLRAQGEAYSWTIYHSLEEIYQWLHDIVSKFPGRAELISIGKSVENRDIYVVAIKNQDSNGKVIVEGGIHGNEWVSIEFVTYLIHNLLNLKESQNSILIHLGAIYDWFLLPVVNPDGFKYSRTDRLWKKNRRIDRAKNITGVDLNRNFAYSFGKYGASQDSKDDDYCGPEPFSEPESKLLAEFIKSTQNLKFYFSFHNYGQKIIIPYGDRINHVENYAEMENYGKQAVLKMYKMSGVKYRVGTVYDTLGVRISGNSASWVKKNKRVKYVFTFLIRDNGSYGIALPADQILSTCKETLVGMLEVMTARPKRVKLEFLNSATSLKGEIAVFAIFVFCIL